MTLHDKIMFLVNNRGYRFNHTGLELYKIVPDNPEHMYSVLTTEECSTMYCIDEYGRRIDAGKTIIWGMHNVRTM